MLNGANNSTVIKNFWWRWLFPAIFLAITCICIMYTLSTRLRESSVDWRIPEDERDEILLRWMKTTVRDAERIMKRGGF